MLLEEMIEKERDVGVRFGPAYRHWLIHKDDTPSQVRRYLQLAAQHPHLVCGKQSFMTTEAEGPRANGTALVATTIEALWSAALYTPIPANSMWEGKTFFLRAGGIMSFAATGTLTITPNVGTATGGATLGASIGRTSPGTTTNAPWMLEGIFVCRTIGSSGTIIGTGTYNTNGTATLDVAVAFGGTSATIDTTAASGITIGKTLSVAGSVTTQYVSWQSGN